MASRTVSSRPRRSARSGTTNGMAGWRILSLARTSRLATAAGGARKEPAATLRALGDDEWNGGLPDLVLGAPQPLAHGRRRGEERRGDGLGVEPQHHLQDQRRAEAG